MTTALSGKEAVFENLEATLLAMGNLKEDQGIFRYSSEMPLFHFNGTFVPGFQKTPLLKEHDAFFKNQELSYCAWLDQEVEGDPLLEAGFVNSGGFTGVACPLDEVTFHSEVSEGISVERVDEKDLQAFAALSGEMFGIPKEYHARWESIIRGRDFTHYFGLLKEKIVGTFSVFMSGKVAALCNGFVVPEARYQGVATVMTQVALLEAARLEAEIAVALLMPDKQAIALCEKFGFKQVCEVIPYFKEFY